MEKTVSRKLNKTRGRRYELLRTALDFSRNLRPIKSLTMKNERKRKKLLETGWINNFQLVDSNINDLSPKPLRILFDSPIKCTLEGKRM